MVNLYRDPSGEKIFDGTNPSSIHKHNTTSEHHSMAKSLPDLTDTEKIDLLNARIKGLEEKIEEKNKRIIQLEAVRN